MGTPRPRRVRRTWTATCGALLLLGLALVALRPAPGLTKPTFLSEFNAEYGTAATRLNACSVCHVAEDVFDRNPYGQDFAASGMVFSLIEQLDSDGDGWPNLAVS